MSFYRFYHVYPAHILRGHSIGAARTFARTLHGLDQICTDFARIHTDVHGRTDAARTLHGHFMVPLVDAYPTDFNSRYLPKTGIACSFTWYALVLTARGAGFVYVEVLLWVNCGCDFNLRNTHRDP